MKIDVLTLFPSMVEASLSESILKRAIDLGHIDIRVHQYRDYANNRHRKVDDAPYGGGAGLVMTVQPVESALEDISSDKAHVIYFSPKGEKLSQKKVIELSKYDHLVMLCGHYEGFDQRIIDMYVDEEISIGDYVLTGGELAAAVSIDAISRHVDGVLGKSESLSEESFEDNLLEYPHYTRPEDYKGEKVPEILLSGHHGNIDKWRYLESLKITYERRKDLFSDHLIDVIKSGDKKQLRLLAELLEDIK